VGRPHDSSEDENALVVHSIERRKRDRRRASKFIGWL
jgi:hypothetical protein